MMRRSALWLLLLCLMGIGAVVPSALAKPLVADISSHAITLSTRFEGTQLMLFGARNDAGDVVVVVRGPARKAVVRKKERVFGIWVNRDSETYPTIPGFYAMATSRPFDEMMKTTSMDALGIGAEAALEPFVPEISGQPVTKRARRAFSQALLAYLQEEALYDTTRGNVAFIEETLFKTTITFPDSTPRGVYTAEVYLFSDGVLVGSYTFPIEVFKVGLDATLFDAAHRHPLGYGLGAVFMALLVGWAASTIFRRL
jgi:uncharacterized protein (TIGR02186 family)